MANFIDDNSVQDFVDDNGIKLFVDDNGIFLGLQPSSGSDLIVFTTMMSLLLMIFGGDNAPG